MGSGCSCDGTNIKVQPTSTALTLTTETLQSTTTLTRTHKLSGPPSATVSGEIYDGEPMSFHKFMQTDAMIFEYKFLRSIGKGNTGAEVFEVLDTETNEIYAAKKYDKAYLYKGSLTGAKSPIELVTQEMNVLTKLNSPFVLKLKEVIADDNTNSLIFITTFAGSGKLTKLLEKGEKITTERLECIFYQMCKGVEAIHSSKIAHRDIKTENFVMTEPDKVILIDFSAAQFVDVTDMTNETVGTPLFTSPEAFSGNEFHALPADIWALGVCFFQLAYDRFPFVSKDLSSSYSSALFSLSKAVEEPLQIPQDIEQPESLISVIKATLEKDPLDRPTIFQLLEYPFIKEGEKLYNDQYINCL